MDGAKGELLEGNPTRFIRLLGELSEQERFSIIRDMLNDPKYGTRMLKVANASLREPRYFEELLQIGVDTADAYNIKFWLECTVPRIGFKKTARILLLSIARNRAGVRKALYYLPQTVPSLSAADSRLLNELRDAVQDGGASPG